MSPDMAADIAFAACPDGEVLRARVKRITQKCADCKRNYRAPVDSDSAKGGLCRHCIADRREGDRLGAGAERMANTVGVCDGGDRFNKYFGEDDDRYDRDRDLRDPDRDDEE